MTKRIRVASVFNIVLLILALVCWGFALSTYLRGLGIPYDDVGALYHLGANISIMFLAFAGDVLLIADGIWVAVRLIIRGRKKAVAAGE